MSTTFIENLLKEQIGDTTILQTTNKTNIVSALNELYASHTSIAGSIPTFTVEDDLIGTGTTNALSANQGRVLNGKIGDLTTLVPASRGNLVAAINQVDSDLVTKIGNLATLHASITGVDRNNLVGAINHVASTSGLFTNKVITAQVDGRLAIIVKESITAFYINVSNTSDLQLTLDSSGKVKLGNITGHTKYLRSSDYLAVVVDTATGSNIPIPASLEIQTNGDITLELYEMPVGNASIKRLRIAEYFIK